MNLMLGLMDYRKQKGYNLLLIKFEESTNMYNLDFTKIGDIRWQVPGIPIIGLEIKEDIKEKIIKKIKKMDGFVNIKEVDCFHEHSFKDIGTTNEDEEEENDEDGFNVLMNIGLSLSLRAFSKNLKSI